MVTHSVWRVSTPHRIGVLVNNGTIRRAVCQISDVMTTKLCGAHICPPSAVMPSQSMGASHACQQHIRRHAASQHRHVFRRQLSRPYVHRLSWCERSQRRVSSKQVRSKATQNSVFARTPSERHVPEGSVSVVLLAGGSGKRMKASMPKQYLNLVGQPIAMHSLRTFGSMPEVGQIVVVCDPSYRDLFQQYLDQLPSRIQHSFAIPGVERQDSVYSGLQAIRSEAALVAIHDSARPLIDPTDAANCMADAQQVGAAVLGVPVKPTIKEVNSDGMVVKTLIRANLWEVQTPQVCCSQCMFCLTCSERVLSL
ncbi:TPA: hypothetical protein ACH3X3_000977 [Trebouxia sp. C0006]